MTIRPILLLSACLLAAPVIADDKWEVTTSMEMVGMPFQMPPTTRTVCLPPGEQGNEKMVPADKNCKMTSFTNTGNTSRFRMECGAPQKMTGEGEITRLGKDAYKGMMRAQGNFNGENADLTMKYAGRKIGSCPASENIQNQAKAAIAQQQAMVGQTCKQLADGMVWQMGDQMGQSCPTLKADICKKAKTVFAKAADPEALRNLQKDRGDWRELAGYCGIDAGSLAAKACTTAKQQRLWGAVAEFCGSEAEALAEQNCTGRSYTVIMLSEYGPLCEHFADSVHVDGADGSKLRTGNNTVNQALDGINKLRGLFGK